MREAVIVAMGRSPIGKAPRGSLRYTGPEEVASQVIKGIFNKLPNFDLNQIDDFVVGCAFPEAEQGFNMARVVGLKAGLPNGVPGQTVNRFCASGLQTLAIAANSIAVGQTNCILAGGIESMSTVPIEGNMKFPDASLIEARPEVYMSMGQTAENVAEKYGITRQMQDEFSAMSHQRAEHAIKAGYFDEEIIPIEAVKPIIDEQGNPAIEKFMFNMDEGVRMGADANSFSKLRPVFKNGGTVTAANASQMSDGAAFVLMMSRQKAEDLGLKPIAIFKQFASVGVAPELMGIGPMKAIPKVLDLEGINQDQIELIELNEAFASQSIACINALNLDMEKTNVNGGAIALGHPLGCTGTYLTIKLLSEMKRRDCKRGMVSMCIGGGMGAAAILERP